ncbi:integrator complex subunit 1 [Leptidea sinapis]|uniref:integrator complex subunit 1 n=1 Tax=Leptidea sinapis TaxID=189913 RepID=UPI0021C29C33|nr:integrator complex subunit 1 [Leptidea sinapis]
MERGKMSSSGRGGKSKAPQHPQDIFALGSKSTVVVSRDSEKRNIHKPSTSGVAERKRDGTTFGSQPPTKRSRIGSPAESVSGTSLEIDPVDLVPNVLQALDTHNSDKLLGLLTGSIRLLKSQRSKPDPILCMSMLYLTKIRPNMFAHETVTQTLCTLLKREQGVAFKSKGNPLVFVLACNMLYAAHKDSNNWPDTFIKVYIEDALNERWWVDCTWCKCLVENIVTAFGTKQPPSHLIPTDSALGTMSPSGSGSPLMGTTEDEVDTTDLEYSVFPRYSSSYETVEALVLEAIKEQIQRRAAPDALGKGFLKLLSATCGFPEIRMIAANRLEGWLHSGKVWRAAQELLAHVCVNAAAAGASAARDHEVLAQLARMRLKTKPLQTAYQACLREMVSESPGLLRSVVTHIIYNELSTVRSPNNMAVLAALIHAQPHLVPAAMADTYQELLLRTEDFLRPLRALTRECIRAARSDTQALLPLARSLAHPPPHEPPAEIRERAFSSIADLFCCCCLVTAAHRAHCADYRAHLCALQQQALAWMLDTAVPVYRPQRHEYQLALNKIMFLEPAETYSKVDNWPPESERALTYRLCCEAPLPQNTLLRLIFIGISKDTPVSGAEVFELLEQLVRRASALPPDDSPLGPLHLDKLEMPDYIFQLCQFHPPDNIALPPGYSPPALAITSLYWRGWLVLTMLAAHNPHTFAERAANAYPTLRALIECCITGKPSIEWSTVPAETERSEAERAAILQLETHLAAASTSAKLPVTEHSSRLLSQLTLMEPLGPARRPPAGVLDALQTLSSQLRLGRLLCRQPALLLQLVERHGTRRAMPWLHQLLRHERLELSVLPVQCLCEFLCAGGGDGSKAGELSAHVRRTLQSEEGARAVLHYYLQRLAHAHRPTRAAAARGLKLVLSPSDDASDLDYNAEVSPETWLPLLPSLLHWEALRSEALRRIRAALLVECIPAHLAAYLAFLAEHAPQEPDLTDTVLDLSQVLMERTTVMGHVLPASDARGDQSSQHRALYAATLILHTHLKQVLAVGEVAGAAGGEEGEAGAWGAGGERVSLAWRSGRRATVHVVVAHAHLKLLCYGPSVYDTNQEMYSWLQSTWLGPDAPETLATESAEEGVLLPDWLRLHLVRSARPALLEAGLRSLPAHKLALFIQTFGMPVPAMSALLNALDACPAGAVVRLGVERGYMAQLLRVQRARGATGGHAFAAALRLQRPPAPPDDTLFDDEPLPEEMSEAWEWSEQSVVQRLDGASTKALLDAAFHVDHIYTGDYDTSFTQLYSQIAEESRSGGGACIRSALEFLRGVCVAADSGLAARLCARPARVAPLLRALALAAPRLFAEISGPLLSRVGHIGGPVCDTLRALTQPDALRTGHDCTLPVLPPKATKQQIIAAFESATSRTLEVIGNRVIETQDTHVIVDAISELLHRNQRSKPAVLVKVKEEESGIRDDVWEGSLGCGLLLDWLAELHTDAAHRLMRVMFVHGGCAWRPQLVGMLVQRASWPTLHRCLEELLGSGPQGWSWSASAVLQFAETLVGSPRISQGRDRSAPAARVPRDTLALTHAQLERLVRYVGEEAWEAQGGPGGEQLQAARRHIEARLPLVLRCCSSSHALLAAALAAADSHPLLLLLLYMKVPRVVQLLRECEGRAARGGAADAVARAADERGRAAARASTSATDRVSHTLLTALAASADAHHSKDHGNKMWRIESAVRAVWSRQVGAGERALPLAGALLRGVRVRHRHQLLAALEMLPDNELFAAPASDEIHGILECFLTLVCGAGESRGGSGALPHRVAALLRRYLAARPQRAASLLHKHRDIIASQPALSAVLSGDTSASVAPPPLALEALQRRTAPPHELLAHTQELEAWGVRRGGAWGGRRSADAILRAVAPLAAAPLPALRQAALSLLAKLLPAACDTQPGMDAILECLESQQPEVVAGALERLPELLAGLPERGAGLLARVFELGLRSRAAADVCLAKCVATINLHRAC